MIHGAPPGSVGTAHPSGWSNEKIFVEFLNHFITHVKPSQERPVLLLLDNHDSHVNIPAIDLAKSSGIVVLTFHPHTSHKMQPWIEGFMAHLKHITTRLLTIGW